MLGYVPDTARYAISIVCGNDIYRYNYDDKLDIAITNYVNAVENKPRTHFAVAGMSAATWEYDTRQAGQDINAEKMREVFRSQLVCTGSGATELQGLKLFDAIGHVHPDSTDVVFKAFTTQVDKCLDPEQIRILDELPPAPPAPPVVEQPWAAVWQSEEKLCILFGRSRLCAVG